MPMNPEDRVRGEQVDTLKRERDFYEKVEREQDLDEEEARKLLEERDEFPKGEPR